MNFQFFSNISICLAHFLVDSNIYLVNTLTRWKSGLHILPISAKLKRLHQLLFHFLISIHPFRLVLPLASHVDGEILCARSWPLTVPICSFCEFTKATEQNNRTEQVLNLMVLSWKILPGADVWTQYTQPITAFKQALNSNTKPVPAEDCYFSHCTVQNKWQLIIAI